MSIKRRKNYHWTVSSHNKKNAYYLIYLPEHPNCRSDGSIFEHRIIMEKKIGRFLKQGERIHHLNQNGLDNSPNNLQLCANTNEHNSIKHPHFQGWFKKGTIPWNKTFTAKKCLGCDKQFYLPPRGSKKRQTCSHKCKWIYWHKRNA